MLWVTFSYDSYQLILFENKIIINTDFRPVYQTKQPILKSHKLLKKRVFTLIQKN